MTDYKKLAKEVFEAQNKARTNPKHYIPKLTETLKLFKGDTIWRPGEEAGLQTQEGPGAYRELISFLESQKPIEPLSWNEDLSKAAQDHADDIGPKGITGHSGSDGSDSTARMKRYGEWQMTAAENIDFGGRTGEDIIMNLMVDDGNPNRGHRKNIFNPALKVTGVACNKHAQYRHCCVLDYAGGFTKRGEAGANYGEDAGFGKVGHPNLNLVGTGNSPNTSPHKPDLHIETKEKKEKKDKKDKKEKSSKSKSGCFGWCSSGKSKSSNAEKKSPETQESSPNMMILSGSGDPDEPDDCISTKVTVATQTIDGKKVKKEIRIYTMKNGETKTVEREMLVA
jgi:uncharacterized protein YkwD